MSDHTPRFFGLLFRENPVASVIEEENPRLFRLMQNRIHVGGYRYDYPGAVPVPPGHSVVVPFHRWANGDYSAFNSNAGRLNRKLARWVETGNVEPLVDALNYVLMDCMLGGERPDYDFIYEICDRFREGYPHRFKAGDQDDVG